MSLWEYKVITSGKGGFATPALLEKFLNDLGRDEWEIIHFQSPAENFLAFTGLARRSTQRDWTLEDAAAAAAKIEAEKLRAEFEAKFKAASSSGGGGTPEERAPSFLEEKVAPDDGFRKPVDTSHDAEPETDDEKADEWDKLVAAEEDELPTFFEAIKPHMRRNQRGPGMSVGAEYLAKKWDLAEDDVKGALAECGFVIPADEDAKAEYLEYDGDLYWLNINRRGELWINTKEKPRPVFRPVKAQKVAMEEEPAKTQAESGTRSESSEAKPVSADASAGRPERVELTEAAAEPQNQNGKSRGTGAQLPSGPALLDKIRPHMRRNRRGPGGSGSTSFLSRALRTNEAELKSAFAGLGLTVPGSPNDKPVFTELGNEVWWLNLDSRGGLWINGREKKEGETISANGASSDPSAETPLESAPGSAAPDAVPAPEIAPSVATGEERGGSADVSSSVYRDPAEPPPLPRSHALPDNSTLAAVRLLLKETKTGAVAGNVERLAEELGKSVDDFLATLVGAGLKVPEKAREKPLFVEHAGEILWLNKNAKGELWLNAKASKFADKAGDDEKSDDDEEGESTGEGGESDGEKKSRRGGRGRPKKAE